jgi:predicted phage terminase large subunit-like protein
MKMRISDGPSAFDSEKQNEPINPDDCLFQESWFKYYDDQPGMGAPESSQYFAAVDPSMGKSSHKADPSAIIIGTIRDCGQIDILEADIQKRHPDAIMEALFEYHKKYKFARVVIEEVQFQELFKDQLIKEGARRQIYLPVEGVRPVSDKKLRITKLQPHIKNGLIRFRRDQRILLDQLKYFPKASHDDGPDALEMLFSLIGRGRIDPQVRIVN